MTFSLILNLSGGKPNISKIFFEYCKAAGCAILIQYGECGETLKGTLIFHASNKSIEIHASEGVSSCGPNGFGEGGMLALLV